MFVNDKYFWFEIWICLFDYKKTFWTTFWMNRGWRRLERKRQPVALGVNKLCVLKHFPMIQTSPPHWVIKNSMCPGATLYLMHYGDAIYSTWKYLRSINPPFEYFIPTGWRRHTTLITQHSPVTTWCVPCFHRPAGSKVLTISTSFQSKYCNYSSNFKKNKLLFVLLFVYCKYSVHIWF